MNETEFRNKIQYGRDYIELHFNSRWEMVQSLWDYLRGLIRSFLKDTKRSEVISVAIIELLENAVKYSEKDEHGLSKVRFRMNMSKDNKLIKVEVENPADHSHLDILRSEYQRIISHPDPKKMFIEKIREAATRQDGKSQLGLVRIIIEARAAMRFEMKGDNICVFADFPAKPK